MKFLRYVNKESHKVETRLIPKKCPKCHTDSNFELYSDGTDGVIDISIIKCSQCDWKKDITPYGLW